MTHTVQYLEDLLAEHFADLDGDGLPVGRFMVADAPHIALPLAERLADRLGSLSYAAFLARHEAAAPAKPTKPTADMIDAIMRRNPPPKPQQAAYFRERLQTTLYDKYEQDTRTYEQAAKDRELFRLNYTPNIAGYLRFLAAQDLSAQSFFFVDDRVLPILEEHRKRHTYVSGRTGSGKSEVLKVLILDYVKRKHNTAVVILDPASDFSQQVARWEELAASDRLVFIDPSLNLDYIPVFNPLEIPDDERNPDDISRLVDGLVDCFHSIGDHPLTPNMKLALAVALTVLCYKKGSSIEDLMDFLGSDESGKTAEWMAFARAQPLGRYYRAYLDNDFFSKGVTETKNALRIRFTTFFGANLDFGRMVNGKSSFDLEELIKQKKVIIFRIQKGRIGEKSAQAIGKFIISRMKAFAFRQGENAKIDRVTTHFFIDEFHNYISPALDTILKEMRQYGLHLTLAQQILGADMDTELRRNILGNTAVKITGENEQFTLKSIAAETGCDLDDLMTLERRNTSKRRFFHIKSGSLPGIIVEIPDSRVDNKHGVSDEVWSEAIKTQLARYYRRRDQTDTIPAPQTPAIAPAPIDGRTKKRAVHLPAGIPSDLLKF